MTSWDVRAATEADARSLAPRLRAVDAKECEVLGGHSPLEALLDCARDPGSRTITIGDTPVAMFGAAGTPIPGVGVPWLLATDDFGNAMLHPETSRAFLRGSRLWVRWATARYAQLFNLILAENKVAIRWLKWLGFTFTPTHDPAVLLFYKEAP